MEALHRFASNYYFGTGLGFQLGYESTDITHWSYKYGECGGNFTTPNGRLTSPSYPEKYLKNADCIYTISQPTDTIIVLIIISIDLNGGSDCIYSDYLEIRDGSSVGSPLLDKLCGNEIPPPIQATQNHVWMK